MLENCLVYNLPCKKYQSGRTAVEQLFGQTLMMQKSSSTAVVNPYAGFASSAA